MKREWARPTVEEKDELHIPLTQRRQTFIAWTLDEEPASLKAAATPHVKDMGELTCWSSHPAKAERPIAPNKTIKANNSS